jgi:hypothetical protein
MDTYLRGLRKHCLLVDTLFRGYHSVVSEYLHGSKYSSSVMLDI